MPGRLEGKVAIVTGAGSVDPDGIGNGRAAAILFAREGARVLLVDRRRELAERTRELIGEDGVAVAFETNITTREGCEAMVAEAVSRWGKLDILDNNVGIGVNGTVVDVSEDSWDLQLRVNVTRAGVRWFPEIVLPAKRSAIDPV